jgi:16S rRNA (cytosine967-C5)-methyltransferase
VNLAKKFSHKGTDKFVNGVLRGTLRQKELLWEKIRNDMPLRVCHPRWLVERWRRQFGAEETNALCSWDNEPASLSLRVNSCMTTRDAFLQDLREMGCEAEVSLWCPDGIVMTRLPGLQMLLETFPHSFYVQDESSMLPALALAPQPGERVLDLCAAPGGKTTHIAALMENTGRVTACDIYPHKLKLIAENAARLKLENIKTELQDGCVFREEWEAAFDRVLVDAPCSGLGVLRRKPDARWNKSAEEIAALPPLQGEILDSAAKALKAGGVLVYSTCTIDPSENDEVVEAFLTRHPEFTLEQTGSFLPVKRPDKMVQLYPQRDGTDGFFIARMRKAKG